MEKVYTRDIYGKTLLELGKKHQDLVVLDADLSGSTRTIFSVENFLRDFLILVLLNKT